LPVYAIILTDMKRIYAGGPVYEAFSPVDRSLKIVIAAVILIELAIAVWLIQVDIIGTWFMLGSAVFVALLFYFVFPKKYHIYEDRIKIILGGPFAVNVPFAAIKEFKSAPELSYAYGGVKFATNSKNIIEIVRKKGMDMIISPHDRDLFLQQADWALANWRKTNGSK
jgi:hypothetical protein